MGRIIYGAAGLIVDFEDRVLAHIQLVIGAKLRRDEGFFFTWRNDPAVGDGRSSVWLHSSVPITFRFASARRHTINAAWLEELSVSANRPAGLFLTDEPGSVSAGRPLATGYTHP
ncbi:ATP-dependent DNA ligase [Glaciihabitans sp. dw_435]|uniref:DUF7882 family protein n=1 Tax=Glaciihabitans sp. dw_435 TaxID=2720081 RepID=UPI001BD6CBC0|nr:ATP-dependent DNA ligase [Glaciihabitans sp. dw_435]